MRSTITALFVGMCLWIGVACLPALSQDRLPAPPEGFSWQIEDTWRGIAPDDKGRWQGVEPADTRGYRDTTDGDGGTVSANCDHFPNEGHANAFDNSEAKWCARQADIVLDYTYADGKPRRITAYTLTSANDYPGRDPVDWQLFGSKDGDTWTVIDRRQGESFMTRHFKRLFDVAHPENCTSYRLKVLKNGGEESSQLQEVEYLVPAKPVPPATDAEIAAALALPATGDGVRPLFADDLADAILKPGSWTYEDGVLEAVKGGDIWTGDLYGDFVLDLEFQCESNTNSGVFVRCAGIQHWLHSAIEVQVLQSEGDTGKHSCGSIFDVHPPSTQTVKPAGEWNTYRILALKNRLVVVLNGERVNDVDLDRWTEPGRNPDGTKNKFRYAYRDMARRGHIGLQYHGQPVSYRAMTIRPLP